MNRVDILSALQVHQPWDMTEAEHHVRTIAFVQAHEDFWQRSTLEGHLTGSAWVVSPDRTQVLLIHHAKLDRWFQPGGHADLEDDSLAHTGRREAMEECGLTALHQVSDAIFDIDVHPIPAKGGVPEHFHYDVRYLFEADPALAIQFDAAEIKGMQWVPVTDLLGDNTAESIRRMAEKIAGTAQH